MHKTFITKILLFFMFMSAPLFSYVGVSAAAGLSIPKSTGIYKCTDLPASPTSAQQAKCLQDNPISQWIIFFVNLLSVVIVIGGTAMILFAGVQYITAADSPDRIKTAKQKITNVIIGIIAYFFLYAFLQWLIPGGAF
jgi:hypothetical protein